MGSNTRILSPNIVNEARFGHTRIFNAISTADAFSVNTVGSAGHSQFECRAAGPMGRSLALHSAETDFSGLGDGSDDPYQIADNTTQFVDNLSWIKGKHTFKFGFEYERDNFDTLGNQFLRGQFTFQPNATQSLNPHRRRRVCRVSARRHLSSRRWLTRMPSPITSATISRSYVDDTWKITPKLTLSLGLRWEVDSAVHRSVGKLFKVVQPQIIDSVANAPTANRALLHPAGKLSECLRGQWSGQPSYSVHLGGDARRL